jgi:hypothetical protein
MRSVRIVAAVVVVTALGAGCSGDENAGGPGAAPDLRLVNSLESFESCDAVRDWARDELAPRVGAYGFPGNVGVQVENAGSRAGGDGAGAGGDVVVSDGAVPTEAEASGSAGAATDVDADAPASPPAPAPAERSADESGAPASSHSGTNVQVEGVDEPDIVKTDGDRILAVADGRLHLASPGEGRIVDTIDLPEGVYDGEMVLAGDRVLLFASGGYAIAEPTAAETDRSIVPPEVSGTRVVQVDITGDQLAVSETFELDGSYVSARMTDDVVRLVLQANPEQRLPLVTPVGSAPEAEAQAQQVNQEAVEQAAAEDFMPRWRQLGPGGEVADEGALVGCEQAHAPETFSGFGMVTVVSVDLSEGLASGVAAANGAGVMAGGQTVYASAEHLYVAGTEWVDPEAAPDGGDDVVPPEDLGTDIHRFDISDPAQATYEMSGHVDGTLLNQFAMDEHDGNLRVATTTGSAGVEGAGESESHVVVLGDGEGALTQVGGVSGLGHGESIFSVRFMGDVGYVVTFEQTDPLYTIDLSDPANPRVAGELEMLGYSAYLHPVGDGRLIGVGQDATDTGSQLGTQVALFDVRDPAAPTRVAQATLPNASSEAEWEHRAFLWWPDTSLVAIPASSYEAGAQFEGVVGYRVDIDGAAITELGRVSHPGQVVDGGEPVPVPLPAPVPPPDEPTTGGGSAPAQPPIDIVPEQYPTPVMRSLVIGDRLWTVSSAGLASSDLETLGGTTFIPFA